MIPRACALALALAAPARAASTTTYAALLADPRVAASLVWEGEGGPVAYPDWDAGRKQALAQALADKELGKPPGLTAAPALVPASLLPRPKAPLDSEPQEEDESDARITGADAWKIYLAHAAHSLWLERHGAVPWPLAGMKEGERALLLDSRKLLKRHPSGDYRFMRGLMGHALSWEPAVAWRFLKENGMLGATPEATVLALADWANANLRHIIHPDTYLQLYGYAGPPPVDRILYPEFPGPRKVGGCWGVTGFFAAALRGANIPVENAIDGAHSRPFFPTAGRRLHHGDDIYTSWVGPTGNRAPAGRILLTEAEWNALVEKPARERDHYLGRRVRLLAREFLTDGPLYELAKHGAAHLDESLQGSRADNELIVPGRPFLAEAERNDFLAAAQAELARVGGGDREAGKRIVLERVRAFYR